MAREVRKNVQRVYRAVVKVRWNGAEMHYGPYTRPADAKAQVTYNGGDGYVEYADVDWKRLP